jgi:hypothetical protein
MQTTDSRNLFQSSASLSKQDARQRKLVRAAKVGDPIELGSKVVRMVVRGQEAYTAESGWVARRVDLRVNSRCLFFFPETSHESDSKRLETDESEKLSRYFASPVFVFPFSFLGLADWKDEKDLQSPRRSMHLLGILRSRSITHRMPRSTELVFGGGGNTRTRQRDRSIGPLHRIMG